MSGTYTREEIEKLLNDPNLFLRAVGDSINIAPQLKPTAIAKIIDTYRTRLKEAFGIEY